MAKHPFQMRQRPRVVLAAVVGVAVAAGAAVAQDKLHGAAPSDTQEKKLAALGVGADISVPAAVDARSWARAMPENNQPNADRIARGRKLYFETALSKDRTVSCATCHDATRSFTDRRPVSEGTGGKLGRRNAPTTMNAMLLHSQFWDGRAPTLEVQAGQPILNPVEMALASRDEAVARLQEVGGYEELFQKAYGRDINYDDLQNAIASFERTLVFLDAPFDRYLAGDVDAMSRDARAGLELFNGKARCVSCHPFNKANPLGTDHRFHNIGVSARHQDFESLAKKALTALAEDDSEQALDQMAVATDMSELGRFMVTRSYADIGGFRTPQLRNVGITAPYMHDGSMQTLWDTIDHYNKGGEANTYLDGGIEALALSEQEIDQLVAFMFALTDVRFADLNKNEMARQKKQAAEQRPFRDEKAANRVSLGFGKGVAPSAGGVAGKETE